MFLYTGKAWLLDTEACAGPCDPVRDLARCCDIPMVQDESSFSSKCIVDVVVGLFGMCFFVGGWRVVESLPSIFILNFWPLPKPVCQCGLVKFYSLPLRYPIAESLCSQRGMGLESFWHWNLKQLRNRMWLASSWWFTNTWLWPRFMNTCVRFPHAQTSIHLCFIYSWFMWLFHGNFIYSFAHALLTWFMVYTSTRVNSLYAYEYWECRFNMTNMGHMACFGWPTSEVRHVDRLVAMKVNSSTPPGGTTVPLAIQGGIGHWMEFIGIYHQGWGFSEGNCADALRHYTLQPCMDILPCWGDGVPSHSILQAGKGF